VTPLWLNSALPSLPPVDAVEWELISEGFGLTGVVARLHLRYERPAEAAASSLILKLPMALPESASHYREAQSADDDAMRRYFERSAREVDFYREIAPEIDGVAPNVYFIGTDLLERVVVMLLEDLSEARNGDVLAGCGVEDARAVIEQIARVHARWWNRAAPGWLPWWGGDHAPRQQRLARQIVPFLDRWGPTIPPEVVAIIERLGTTYASLLEALDRRPRTIIHADLHLDNVLFDVPTRNAPVILDWQSLLLGPAMLDVGRFIAESLSPADRRQHEVELLELYHECLVAGGVPNYSLNQLQVDYRLSLARTLPGIVAWLANVDLDRLDGRERQLMEAALGDRRLVSALVDHNVLGLLNDL
jgi:hypothetical protein